MTLQEIIQHQKEYDAKHSSAFHWDSKISDDNIEMLMFLLTSITGELGETANTVKKIVRGDCTLKQSLSHISEELADIFIYLIKLSYQLGIDLEQVYLEKMQKNSERFKHYERTDDR